MPQDSRLDMIMVSSAVGNGEECDAAEDPVGNTEPRGGGDGQQRTG